MRFRAQLQMTPSHPVSSTKALIAGKTTATNALDQKYTWDSINNLVSRIDGNGDGTTGGSTETFNYDGLNRLTNYKIDSIAITDQQRSVSLQYNALGMLLYKSDVGVYNYNASGPTSVRPHALASLAGSASTNYNYDLNGNRTSASTGKATSLGYTSFNLPDSTTGISGPGVNGATALKTTWSYDKSHARIKQTHVVTGGVQAGTRTTWYIHPDNAGGLGFESETNAPTVVSAANPSVTSNRHFLSAGGQVIGVLVSTGALPTLAVTQTAPVVLPTVTLNKVEYWHKDQLGSLTATSDHNGAVTARYAYDPFGKRRFTTGAYNAFGTLVVDWSNTTSGGNARGFTGHEMLDDLGLIHMNGRLFDPTLGIFIQADPLIQAFDCRD
jgi:RHS repeat-associated protein